MSELVAPYSRKHLYLVLHQYNSSDKPVLARAQVIKDSSFFPASSSTYIAAEAFRISLFGNPESGYCYQYIQPSWFIAADMDDTDSHSNTRFYSDCNLMASEYNFVPDTEHYITFSGRTAVDPGSSINDTTSLGDVYSAMASELNDYRCTSGAILTVEAPNDSDKKLYIKLLEKPSLNLTGPGFGANGLGWMHGNITTIQPDPLHGATPIFRSDDGRLLLFQCDYRTKKKTLPDGMTLNDFAVYMSSGVNLYSHNEPHTPMLEVVGPHMVFGFQSTGEDDILLKQMPLASGEDGHILCPFSRLIANEGEIWDTGQIQYYYTNANGVEDPSNIKDGYLTMKSGSGYVDWYYDNGDEFVARLTVRPSSRTYMGESEIGDPITVHPSWQFFLHEFPEDFMQNRYFAYTCTDRPGPHVKAFRVPAALLPANEQIHIGDLSSDDWHFHSVSNYVDDAKALQIASQLKIRNRIESRSGEPKERGVMCVNEMFEMFNTPEADNSDPYWQLQSHSNGGFVIHLLKPMARFQIAKEFADELGLNSFITTVRRDLPSKVAQKQINYIFVEIDSDDNLRMVDESFENLVLEDPLTNYWQEADGFSTHERTELSEGNLYLPDLKDAVCINKQSGKRYKLMSMAEQVYHTQRTFKTDINAAVKFIEGVECYEWEKPPLGSILNTSRVSIESFALFSSIQVILPDLPFAPQITSYSAGERALLELRFPITYGGASGGTGVVSQTSDDKIGDIIWNVGGAGHQWLPVSSIGNLYSLTAQCNLVYRDANSRPPRPVHISQGGVWQLKVCLLEVK